MMICRLFCIWYVSALPNLVKKNRNDDSAVFVRTSDVVNHIIDFFCVIHHLRSVQSAQH